VIQPLAGIVSAFNQEGATNTDPSTIPFWGMVGAFCLFLNGFSSVIVGFAACVADSSHILATIYLVAINQVSLDGSRVMYVWCWKGCGGCPTTYIQKMNSKNHLVSVSLGCLNSLVLTLALLCFFFFTAGVDPLYVR
jgi:hypothetical protein